MGKFMLFGLAALAVCLPADAECQTAAPTPVERALPRHAPPARAPALNPAPVPVTPPSLTGQALRDELQASWKRGEEERAALQKERAELEKLRAEIAQARKSLREETTRLEDLLKRAPASPAPARAASTAVPRAAAPTPPPGGASAAKKPAEPVGKLTRMVGSMKPEQAGALLARLERGLAVQILRRMSPSQAGAVLGRLPVEISADLASRVARPDVGGRP